MFSSFICSSSLYIKEINIEDSVDYLFYYKFHVWKDFVQ